MALGFNLDDHLAIIRAEGSHIDLGHIHATGMEPRKPETRGSLTLLLSTEIKNHRKVD